jgi:hypothetical protein
MRSLTAIRREQGHELCLRIHSFPRRRYRVLRDGGSSSSSSSALLLLLLLLTTTATTTHYSATDIDAEVDLMSHENSGGGLLITTYYHCILISK